MLPYRGPRNICAFAVKPSTGLSVHVSVLSKHIFIWAQLAGNSQHFCGDPVCPDPVWRLSNGCRLRIQHARGASNLHAAV